ncbi:MAG: 2-oxo acid dehydrogenase subunit E2 [Gemmatimonadetes bacterium]|nr:2-oxo acid dehydrogenase subunit E2 [Gemmatimonadota bacterium]
MAETAADMATAQRLPMSPIRRAIAERLVASHSGMAPVTLTAEFDATALVALRSTAKPRPAYNDYLIHFVALALERHPALNSSLHGHDILLHEGIHIGFAVDTESGLLVPVVRDANKKSVTQIARESARLGGQALRGELAGEQMRGGTFTITNLGAAGIDAFTPIINPPQCAILGIGRITQRPAVFEGQVVPRWLTVVSLSFDHRLVDGGPAARFLATLRQLVESPAQS